MAFFLRVAVVGARARGGGKTPEQPAQTTEPEFQNLDQVQADLRQLAGEMPHVAVRALNKTMTGVKTDMVNVVREGYNFKAGALKKRMRISKANRASIQGYVQSKGRPMHLTDIAGTRQTKSGVSVNVRKSTGRQLIPRAFINVGRNSGKKLVFRRAEEGGQMVARYPIEARYAPHPEHVYNAPHNWAKIQGKAAERLDKNIGREIDAEFRKLEGKW